MSIHIWLTCYSVNLDNRSNNTLCGLKMSLWGSSSTLNILAVIVIRERRRCREFIDLSMCWPLMTGGYSLPIFFWVMFPTSTPGPDSPNHITPLLPENNTHLAEIIGIKSKLAPGTST